MHRNVLSAVVIVAGLIAWLTLSPPRLWLNWVKQVEPKAAIGAELVTHYECLQCHRIAGQGALKAANLAGITKRTNDPDLAKLRTWLQDPRAIKADTVMPNFHLSDSEIAAIMAYLDQQ